MTAVMTAAQLEELLDCVLAFDLDMRRAERRECETILPPGNQPHTSCGYQRLRSPRVRNGISGNRSLAGELQGVLYDCPHGVLHRDPELAAARFDARYHPTAEGRTEARLDVLRLERKAG